MGIKRFEEITAWQKARELTGAIYSVTSKVPFAHDYALKDHIRKTTISVMSNIAEGFEREGATEFKRFLVIAKSSAGELKSQLYVALDVGHLAKNDFDKLFALADETSRLIVGFMKCLARKQEGFQ